LNKLKSLDLNYNKLISIENDLFFGLSNLYNLYLLSQNEMTLYNSSFHHLPNISTIVLNESLISKYKCLFMHNLERDIQRNVSNKYIFYKSINLISLNFSFNESLNTKCDLMFHFYQFKVHFNLKTDYDNELFFDLCQKILIKRKNNFDHNKRNCFASFEFNDKKEENEIFSLDRIYKVVSNIYYLLSMALILSLLIPAFYIICRYELFSSFISKLFKFSSSDLEENLKKLEKNIKIDREKLEKIDQTELINDARTLKLKLLKEKIQDNLSMMQKKYKELQSYKSHNTIQSILIEIRVPENDHEGREQNPLDEFKN
jgi:hypothetical protein